MKKYKIGYTAGTYDMFHAGHLNLLKNAKQYCDYLIVGVNSQKLVQSYKNKTPLISENDRLDIVSAIKYVDEAHLMYTLDKVEAYKLYNFDVVFIGSDYKGSKRYIQAEKQLNKLGVDLHFIDYTKRISSTILANKIIDSELNRNYFGLKEKN